MTIEKIADKIRRLIAKADSTTHEAEAETFMAKAEAMMTEYELSLLDLGRLDSDDPVGTDRDVSHSFASEAWVKGVYCGLARYYGAEVIHTSSIESRNKTLYTVIGRESARMTFTLMAPFVARQVRQAAVAAAKEGKFKSKSVAMTAIGNALAVRLTDLVKKKRSAAPVGQGVNALVPVDLIEAEMLIQFPNLKMGKERRVSLTKNAVEAANRVSINRQAGKAPAARQIA